MNALAGTLDPNPQNRKQAETQLADFEKRSGFTVYCLELAIDSDVPLSQRSSAAVFFKNRIAAHWGYNDDRAIQKGEQEQLKQKLIEALLKVYNDTHIRPQLCVALRTILTRDQWLLNEPILQLLQSKSDPSHVYTGLLLLFEATKSLRFSYADRTTIDNYISQTFPILENIAFEVMNNTDYHSGDVLYLILKIFKFSALNTLPQYFYDINKLSTWISIHLNAVQRQLDPKILELDPSDRALDRRVKCYKWGFGNLHKFYQRYIIPTSKNASPEFVDYFNKNYTPEILKVYFPIIEKWSTGTWLSDYSLYHLISFIEKCIMTPAWELIKPHFEIILRHLLFPSLCQESLELFEDDAEEYIRRYFDMNREFNTADVAAVDALFVTVHHRFEELATILNLLNEIFNTYSQDPSLQNAFKVEGGLRILSSVSVALEKDESPVKDQIDQIIDSFVAPHLTSGYEFLRARSSETISILSYTYKDKNVLSKVFQGVYDNFKNDDNLVIQIEAADALRVLIIDPLVTEAISNDVPTIMQKLLHLSRTHELDMIGEVMEAFVERFSSELEPFAIDLGRNLTDQFIRTAQEMMEIQNSGQKGGQDIDKEYQAVSVVNTMTTMTLSMPNVDLEPVFAPAIRFVLSNAAISFLGEVMELLESLTMNKKQISPTVWEIFQESIDSFQTYAVEYFEYYVPFFENVITYGFKDLNSQSPQVQLLDKVINEIISSPVDLDNQGAFEIVEYETLVLQQFNENLPTILKIFKEQDLAPFSVIRVVLASLNIDPSKTLQLLESTNETIRVFEIWYNLSPSLETVYGLKLQIFALLSVLALPQLPNSLEGFLPQLANKLAVSLERLPEAIKKRQSLYNANEQPTYEDEEYGEDDDAFKDTPLDSIDLAAVFKVKFADIQTNLPQRFQLFTSSLAPERLEYVNQFFQKA